MKILFYISTIRGGGAARVMVNLANQFANDKKMGNQITFLTNFSCQQEYHLADSVKRLWLEDTERKDEFVKKNINRVKGIRKIVKQEKPELIVAFMAENNIRAIFACLGLPVKLLISVRNDPKIKYGEGWKGKLIKKMYNRVDGIVFQTQDARDWFGMNLKPLCVIIPNPVSEEFYQERKTDTNLGYPDRATDEDIVTVGKFMRQKNHRLLIEAFADIKNSCRGNLIIYGDGELRKEYEQYIDELGLARRVRLPGNISDVAEHIRDAKMFVLSSDYEGMPNALMEAMALGLPCIATDCPCGGPRFLIHSMENGILVSPQSRSEMVEAMRFLLAESEKRSHIGVRAKESAESYKLDEIYKEWQNLIMRICREKEIKG